MNYRDKIRIAVSSPYDGSALTYGEWGALRPDQRRDILRLLNELDSADAYAKRLFETTDKVKHYIISLMDSPERYISYDTKIILNDILDLINKGR